MPEINEKEAEKIKKLLAQMEIKQVVLPKDVKPDVPEADEKAQQAKKIAERIKQQKR